MTHDFSEADHERALRAGRQAMARIADGTGATGGAETPAPCRPVVLPALGLRVQGGAVYANGLLTRRRLGPLAGARAEISDVSRRHRIGAATVAMMPLIALAKKDRAIAFVIFTDGTVHERKLDGNLAVRAAQRQVVRFNALAGRAP